MQPVIVQGVGVHVMAPASVLAEDPLPHAVAVQPLREVATARQNGGHSLPAGADRFAVTIDGTESEEEVASLKDSDAVMALLEIAPGVSRVHASRRIFELLQRNDVDLSVIHFRRWVQPAITAALFELFVQRKRVISPRCKNCSISDMQSLL